MTVFPIDIPWGGCVITAEHDRGLLVDLEGCELDARAQTLCRAVLYYFATRRKRAYDVMFSVGCDLVFIDPLAEAEAGECLRNLLTAIRISDSLGAIAEKAA
jgi:hypothetical protein